MDQQILELIDQQSILNTISSLFIGTDDRDWQKVKACFTYEVLFDMTSLVGGEPLLLTSDEIIQSWDEGLKGLEAVHHQIGNTMIEINDTEADAFCYGTATHYFPNPSGNNTRTFIGSYNFHLQKTTDDWKIDHFKFNLKYLEGNEELSTLAQKGLSN